MHAVLQCRMMVLHQIAQSCMANPPTDLLAILPSWVRGCGILAFISSLKQALPIYAGVTGGACDLSSTPCRHITLLITHPLGTRSCSLPHLRTSLAGARP